MNQDFDNATSTTLKGKAFRKDIRAFLAVMLPKPNVELDLRNHYLEVRLIGKEGEPQRFFLDVTGIGLEARLAEIVEQAAERRKNVYVGLALRDNNKSGKAQDCSMLTLLVVDYDEIDGVKIKDIEDHSEREAARQKILERLRSETEYAPTMIVDSGHGYHAYYALDKVVDVRAVAEAIKRKSKWLAARYTECPGDPAMLKISQPIRLPGSFNVKNPNEPRPCKIVEYHPERVYAFSDIPEAEAKPVPKQRALQVAKSSKVGQSQYPIWDCAFLQWMRQYPAKQTYPLWLAAASTLAYFAEEGRQPFHELSHNYSGYSEAEADAMFDKMLASRQQGIGPITYAKIAECGFHQKDNTDAASPAIYIEQLWQTKTLAEMGYKSGENGEKYSFNPNLLADYSLKKNKLCIYAGNGFYQYEDGLWRKIREDQIKRWIREQFQDVKKDLYRCSFGDKAVEMLKLAADQVEKMDEQKHLLNLKNGMFDIDAFELLPHSSQHYSTVQIPLEYNPNAKCDRFENFVDEIMDGDQERVKVVQEMVGYLLTAETIIHKAFFLLGAGANGKSLLLDIVTTLVGQDNVSNLTLQDLERPFSRANLIGKTVNIATENEVSGKGFNSQYFKAIVSGDRIQVEKKYEPSTSYSPICKLVFAVNNLPYSPDKSHGLHRRMFILPFNRCFEGENADKHLQKKLLGELAGILNWALIGLKRLREQEYEFTVSSVVNEAVDSYKVEQNPMLEFMKGWLVKSGPEERISRREIMAKYQNWCQENAHSDAVKMSAQRFWTTFKASCKEVGLPCEPQISNGERYFKKLAFKDKGIRRRAKVSCDISSAYDDELLA